MKKIKVFQFYKQIEEEWPPLVFRHFDSYDVTRLLLVQLHNKNFSNEIIFKHAFSTILPNSGGLLSHCIEIWFSLRLFLSYLKQLRGIKEFSSTVWFFKRSLRVIQKKLNKVGIFNLVYLLSVLSHFAAICHVQHMKILACLRV